MPERHVTIYCTAIVMLLNFVSGTAVPDPIIQEVLYDGPDADNLSVFTELFGTPVMSLDDYTLVGINQAGNPYRSISLTDAVIPDDGLLTIATGFANPDLVLVRDFIANVDWQNGPGDAIELRNPSSSVVDVLQYGSHSNGLILGEGIPAMDVGVGHSLSRDLLGTDTDNNADDFFDTFPPTPGIGPAVVPTPGAVVLGILGLSVAGAKLRKQAEMK